MVNFLEITKSRLRRKLLAYFFTNPDSSLYLRETASILKEDAGNLSKEFVKLEKSGIFVSSIRGNQKYFSLNIKHPLYKDLKSIIFKTVGIEGSLREAVNDVEGVDAAFIYGSFAAKKEHSASDIDILIIGSPDENKLMKKIEVLEKTLQREINYNVYPKKEFKRRLEKKDSFAVNIIKRPKITLKGNPDAI